MGTLNIYKGLSEEYRTIKGNASVNELAHELYPELDLEQCIILNAGEQIAPDYILKDNDIVFIRVIPGATGAVVMAVISLVCAAVAVGAAVYSAVEQQKAQEEMEKAQKQAKALAERITQLPFLKGANNRSALGYNIPYIMGSVYDVPYKLVAGYYTISGENGANQFWNVLLVAGFNNALIQDVSIGTKVIKKPNGTIEIPGQIEEFSYLEDSGENPYYFENDCPFYDPADKLDVKYENEVVIAGLNEKVSCTSFSDELDYNNAVVKQAATNTYKFDVCILFNGLRRYDDGWKSKNVSVKVEWSNDGSTWNDAGNIVTGDINSRKQVRFSKTVTLTAAQCVGKDIQIRLTRITALEESNSQETCYLCYLNCWQYDAAKSTDNNIVTCAPLEQPWRGRTTRLALRIISNESTKDNLDQININAYGKARIWNNDAWTVNRYPTRNPASWVLEVMTTDVHPHSRYNDDEIDLEALGAVYTYCQQNGFYCDGILTEDSKKADILNSILSECNTTMYRDDATGKWTFAIEKAQSTPVALLNEQCIKSVTVTKTFERKPYAVKTTFTNRESWAVDTFYQTVNGKVDSSAVYGEHKVIVENAPKYITTFEHAYKYTHRILAKQQLQPREITVQVGRDGDYYPLYSKIMLQMKQLRIGLSNGIIHGVVVEGGLLKQIITSDFCDFSDSNARYGLIIQAQNDSAKEHLYIEVTAGTLTQYAIGALGVGMIGSGNSAIGFYAPGKTRVLNLRTPLAVNVLPEYGNIYSFGYLNESGEFSRVTNEMMIYNRKQNSDGWELLLKDYNSAIFQFGDIPEYQTNLTTPKESGNMLPEAIMQKMADIADEVSALLENTDFDPSELDQIHARLDRIYELEKKYHTETVEELISQRDELKQKLNNIENSDEALAELEAQCQQMKAQSQKQADILTRLRQKAGKEIEQQLRQRLVPLGMPNVRFEVHITKGELNRNGQDAVSFLFSANTSTPLQPVAQVASGGEIARVMLSLKAMISGAVKLPTIIFDEIDTGVSGKIAEKMADIMQEMGQTERQVISITHLPQIASKGTHHYRVSKSETPQGTISQMQELSADERIHEIAQMLSGSDISEAAIANAKQLLKI